jgi:hypothetical protein
MTRYSTSPLPEVTSIDPGPVKEKTAYPVRLEVSAVTVGLEICKVSKVLTIIHP